MNELFISKISYSVLEALDYMKEKNLLHRDIKPSNILINSTGEVKVCDFGISGILNNSVAHTFKGSECYMPVSCFLLNLCFKLLIIIIISCYFKARKNTNIR